MALNLFKRDERLALRRDYMTVFSTVEGQRVLSHILSVAGVTAPRFHTDPMQTAFNEGQRHLAMSIFQYVHSSTRVLEQLAVEESLRREAQNDKQSHESTD